MATEQSMKADVVSGPGQVINQHWPKATVDMAMGWDTEGAVQLHQDSSTLPEIISGSSVIIIQPTKPGWGTPGHKNLVGYTEYPYKRAFILVNDNNKVVATTTEAPTTTGLM